MDADDFVASFTVLRAGRRAEKLALLFRVYDIDKMGELSRANVEYIFERIDDERLAKEDTSADFIRKLFEAEERPGIESFSKAASAFADATIINWIFFLTFDGFEDIPTIDSGYVPIEAIKKASKRHQVVRRRLPLVRAVRQLRKPPPRQPSPAGTPTRHLQVHRK